MRCDFNYLTLQADVIEFQSTHLHEVWQGIAELFRCSYSVSIHTPTWGVTLMFTLESSKAICFNPHTYMRCDPAEVTFMRSLIEFQSTHLHEVWLSINVFKSKITMFQSTHLHEVWLSGLLWIRTQERFNPHTYMRCDDVIRHHRTVISCFNPHTYMRCDNGVSVDLNNPGMFQSTHLHEVWPFAGCLIQSHVVFQSTHLHEVWLVAGCTNVVHSFVSIHTPTWGVTWLMLFLLIDS